jgi:hypothetical protein
MSYLWHRVLAQAQKVLEDKRQASKEWLEKSLTFPL